MKSAARTHESGSAASADAASAAEPDGSRASGVRVAVSDSRGIRSLAHLDRFLGVERILSIPDSRRANLNPDVALVWGRKETGTATESHARTAGIPVWHLEDGWIRTCSSDAHSRRVYSLLVDPVGVYYDASRPSLIERELTNELFADDSDPRLAQARQWRQKLVAAGVTKYNWVMPGDAHLPSKPFVLVVDQTRDDASVVFGGADTSHFTAMLDAALDENPGIDVVVRTHPDVVSGRREGYLGDAADRPRVRLVAGTDNAFSWLKHAQKIYTVTSQLGYEALLVEREVVVFGAPFYAGWGLTDDRSSHVALQRRRDTRARSCTIDELFHASHISLCRYRSPVDGTEWTLGDCLDHVALQQDMFMRNAKRLFAVGITPWKRRYIEQYLRSPGGSLRFGSQRAAETALAKGEVDALVTWSFRKAPAVSADVELWRLEDGFVRSVGLGSDYTPPGSLVVDTSGLYFDAGAPSDLEKLLNDYECTPSEVLRASRLKRRIVEAGVSKYGGGSVGKTPSRPADKKVVLVVGQVESDESIRRGCFEVATNAALLQATRKHGPNDWIVYRPHPDVVSGNRKGAVDAGTLAACADAIDTSSSIHATLESVDDVHVMTSLTGFEALLRGRRVTTWGAPFYAGWGLTEDKQSVPRRRRRRTLEELLYLAFIKYPRYVDIATGEFVSVEALIDTIEKRQAGQLLQQPKTWSQRQVSKLGNIVRGISYAP